MVCFRAVSPRSAGARLKHNQQRCAKSEIAFPSFFNPDNSSLGPLLRSGESQQSVRRRDQDQVVDRDGRGAAAVFFTKGQGVRGLSIVKTEHDGAVCRERGEKGSIRRGNGPRGYPPGQLAAPYQRTFVEREQIGEVMQRRGEQTVIDYGHCLNCSAGASAPKQLGALFAERVDVSIS